MAERPPHPGLRWLALAVALLPFGFLVGRFNFLCDDAYISFRYARNLAAGLGPVYNPGVEPPVEGYSEFLWVVLMALGEWLGVGPELASRVLSVMAGVVLVTLTVSLLGRRCEGAPAALLASSLFVGCLPPLSVWSTGGMGTMAFSLAILVAFERLFADPERARLLGAALATTAAVLLRADGAYWVLVVAGAGCVGGLVGRRPQLARSALFAGLVAAVVLALHLLWRHSFYDDFLPNTARAKVGISELGLKRGAHYVTHFLLTFPGALVALLLPLLFALRGSLREAWVPLWIVIATFAYSMLVGGDFMCFARFLVPSLPFLALLLGTGLAHLERRAGSVPTGLLGGACALIVVLPAFDRAASPQSWREHFDFRWNVWDEFRSELGQWQRMKAQAEEWAMLGRALALHTRRGESLVCGAIGAVGYYSNLFIYDQHGLVTREVTERDRVQGLTSAGHEKRVPRQFFKPMGPTYLIAFLFPEGRKLPSGTDVRAESLRLIPLDPADGFPAGMRLAVEPYDGL